MWMNWAWRTKTVAAGVMVLACGTLGGRPAEASAKLAGRISLTMGGNGEFDSGAGVDIDHEDMGGHTFGGALLIPVFGSLRVGAELELTPERSVRLAAGDGGGRRDFGKTMGTFAVAEYDIFTSPDGKSATYVTGFGGALLSFPRHEVEDLLEQGNEDGLKTGFALGLGGGITRMLGDRLGLRVELAIEYERIRLLEQGLASNDVPNELRGPLDFKTMRYLLSFGVILDMVGDA